MSMWSWGFFCPYLPRWLPTTIFSSVVPWSNVHYFHVQHRRWWSYGHSSLFPWRLSHEGHNSIGHMPDSLTTWSKNYCRSWGTQQTCFQCGSSAYMACYSSYPAHVWCSDPENAPVSSKQVSNWVLSNYYPSPYRHYAWLPWRNA